VNEDRKEQEHRYVCSEFDPKVQLVMIDQYRMWKRKRRTEYDKLKAIVRAQKRQVRLAYVTILVCFVRLFLFTDTFRE
jgi:hypothetical protein